MNKNSKSKNKNSNSRALTLDSFVRISVEELTRSRLKRSMEEADAAALPGRWRSSTPMTMVTAARSRFACSGAVASESVKEEDEAEG